MPIKKRKHKKINSLARKNMRGQITFSRNHLFIVLAVLLLIITSVIFFVGKLLFPPGEQKKQQEQSLLPSLLSSPIPTISQAPPFVHNEELDKFIEPDTLPSENPLTPQEEALKDALPQTFPGKNPDITGTLVVTSDQSDMRIVLDAELEKDPHDDIGRQLPNNFGPFKLTTMPEGYYTIIADKQAYIPSWITIRIERNKVTRLHVNLAPAELTD